VTAAAAGDDGDGDDDVIAVTSSSDVTTSGDVDAAALAVVDASLTSVSTTRHERRTVNVDISTTRRWGAL